MRILTTFIVVLLSTVSAWSVSKPPSNDCSGILAGLNDIDPSLPADDFRANNVSFDPTFDPRTNISLNQDKAILFSYLDKLNILQVGDMISISDQLMELKMDAFENYNDQFIEFEVERDELQGHVGLLYFAKSQVEAYEKKKKQHKNANDNYSSNHLSLVDLDVPLSMPAIKSEIQTFKKELVTTHEQLSFTLQTLAELRASHTHQVLDALFYSLAGQAAPKYAKKYSDIYFGREGKYFATIEDGTSLTSSSQTVHLSYAMPFEAHEIHYGTNGFQIIETRKLAADPTLKKLLRIFAILRLDYSHQLAEITGSAFREHYHLVQYFSQVNAQAIMELISHDSIGIDLATLYSDGIGETNLQDFKDSMELKLSYRIKTQFQEFKEEPQLLQKIKGKLQDTKMVDIKQSIDKFVTSYGPQLENSLNPRATENELKKRAGAALSSGDIVTAEMYQKLLNRVPLVNSEKQELDPEKLFKKEAKVTNTLDFNPIFNLLRKPFMFSTITVHSNTEKLIESKKEKLKPSDLTLIANESKEPQ